MKFKQLTERPIGVLLLAIALLIERFLPENNGLDFLAGFLFGLSIVLNITFIQRRSKKTISN
jgi:hypothetical protein